MEDTLNKIEKLSLLHDYLTPEIIKEKNVKLGLRNPDGTGVIAGITTKGRVEGYKKIPHAGDPNEYSLQQIPGKLFYCGYDVEKIVRKLYDEKRFGFDEVTYLLLTGELPNTHDLEKFSEEIAKRRALTKSERKIIMEEVQNDNQMYALHSVVSHMSRCDPNPDSIDLRDVSRQCINLIAKVPTIVATNYTFMRFSKGADLRMLTPRPDLSTAENFLYILKGSVPDSYESHLFDIALIMHAEHGGGNNSTFSVRTVSSSGANTYMAIGSGIASLSGYLHGGANEHVTIMMKELKAHVKDWSSDKQITAYLKKVLDKKAGDKSGKLYGFGHAVYTVSDPRALIFREHARRLADMNDALDEFYLYEKVHAIGEQLLAEKKGTPVCANVDFYSGFIYKLMGIPREIFTPIFAMARVVGWSAHRIEQIIQGKIIRPAYLSVSTEEKDYVSITDRDRN